MCAGGWDLTLEALTGGVSEFLGPAFQGSSSNGHGTLSGPEGGVTCRKGFQDSCNFVLWVTSLLIRCNFPPSKVSNQTKKNK